MKNSKDKLTPEERIARDDALLRATKEILGEKREALEATEQERDNFIEENKAVLDNLSRLNTEIQVLKQEIQASEKLLTDIRDTKKVQRSGTSTCVI